MIIILNIPEPPAQGDAVSGAIPEVGEAGEDTKDETSEETAAE